MHTNDEHDTEKIDDDFIENSIKTIATSSIVPHISAHLHSRSYIRTHTCLHTRTHREGYLTRVDASSAQMDTHTHTHTHVQTNTRTHIHTHTHTHTHTYTHTHIHAYTHTHTHTHTHICDSSHVIDLTSIWIYVPWLMRGGGRWASTTWLMYTELDSSANAMTAHH